MARVRMIARLSGTRDGADWPLPGETIDVPDAEADDLERIGVAERVSAKSTIAPEAAVAPAPETASAPKPRARKAAKSED